MNDTLAQASQLAQTISDYDLGRYLSAVGYLVLLYDTFLTIPEEFELVWQSKPNFAKYAYLANKYGVLAILTMEMIILNNSGNVFSVKFCRGWLVIHALCGVVSICISNILVLLRVAALWNNQKSVVFWLFTVLFASTGMSFIAGVVGVVIWLPHITYQKEIQTCGFLPGTPNHFFAPTWGIPLVFDFHVLCIVILNALQRPRAEDTVLARILVKDGLLYFALLTILRLYNVLTVAIAPIGLVFSGAYVSWAIITVTMSRLMLKIRRPRPKQVETFEWPTGNTITAITVTQTDDGSGVTSPSGVPISISHLTPNVAHLTVADGPDHRKQVHWNGEVFKHERSCLCILCTSTPAIPPQADALFRSDPSPIAPSSKRTISDRSAGASSSSSSPIGG